MSETPVKFLLQMSSLTQECLDCTFSWFRGLSSFPLLPSAQEEEDEEDEGLDESMKETAKEKEERKSDHEVARQDAVKVKISISLFFLHSTCCLRDLWMETDQRFLISGFLKNETAPQAALHSRGGPTVTSGGSGCPGDPDSHY